MCRVPDEYVVSSKWFDRLTTNGETQDKRGELTIPFALSPDPDVSGLRANEAKDSRPELNEWRHGLVHA